MLDLIVIGVINIHTTLRTSLKAGVTNTVSEFTERFSGSAFNIALNASLLKMQVGIIAPVGRDAVGLMDVLRRYSVDYSHMVLSSKKNTNVMELHTSTRHYHLYYQGALQDLQPEKMRKEYLRKAKAVHVCFPDYDVTDYVVNALRKEKVLTSVDGFSHSGADIVFKEGKGKKEKKEERKGKTTVVIDFEKGITANRKKIPVFRGDTFHEKGAKDAFIAAFLTRYIKSENVKYSALYGSCAAYLCSQHEQKILTCTKEELDTLFDEKVQTCG